MSKQRVDWANLQTREQKRRAAIEACWRAGDLEAVPAWGTPARPLHKGQRELLAEWKKSKHRTTVICTSRRWGKSSWASTLAEEARLAGKRVLLAADTQKHIREIILPHMQSLHGTCPEDIKPRWDNLNSRFMSTQGKGMIRLIGLDAGQADKARGTEEDLVVIDEAGFAEDLEYFVNSVVLPMLMTTKGRLVVISTPSESTGHYFREMCRSADSIGAFHQRTIYDAIKPVGHLDEADVEMQKADYARRYGENSTPWRREFMCEFVTESSRAVVPEWSMHKEECIEARTRPGHYDPYVVLDMGYSDLTVALFGYWDAASGLLVVEDEVVLKFATPDTVAAAVQKREEELWEPHVRQRVQRHVDAPPLVLAEFNRTHRLPIAPVLKRGSAEKPFKEAALASLREVIHDHSVRIHPRCEVLTSHLEWAIWNASRTSYERPRENAFAGEVPIGHFDALDALIYMNWSVDRFRRAPANYEPGVRIETHHVKPLEKAVHPASKVLKDAFRPSWRRRGL